MYVVCLHSFTSNCILFEPGFRGQTLVDFESEKPKPLHGEDKRSSSDALLMIRKSPSHIHVLMFHCEE